MRLIPFLLSTIALAQTSDWQPLFDGKSLKGWREAQFKGHGSVRVQSGEIVLGPGGPMTGIAWTGDFPQTDYEIRLEARRLRGNDFFASLTFPFRDSFATWVTGGWGGDIVGISSIDGWDASDNETRAYFNFENEHWYKLRLQVTQDRIRAWIDDQPIINVVTKGHSFALRPGETKLCVPLGFASYNTAGALRKIEFRVLNVSR